MKLHFLILSLAILQLTFGQNANADTWVLLSPNTVDNSQTIQNALVFGVGTVIGFGIEAGNMTSTTYNVSGIYTVYQDQSNLSNYRFEVQVIGLAGELQRIKCDVNVGANGQQSVNQYRYGLPNNTRWDQTEQFGAFTFKPTSVYVPPSAPSQQTSSNDTGINSNATLASEIWDPVDPNEVDTNQTIKDALNHGVSSTIELAVEVNAMPDSDYDIIGIYSVLKQANTSDTNYRFEVQVQTPDGQLFRVKCDVNINPTTLHMDTYRWHYGGLLAQNWDQEMEFEHFDFLPDEVFLLSEHYVNAEEDGPPGNPLQL
jgi:hypothetical protein